VNGFAINGGVVPRGVVRRGWPGTEDAGGVRSDLAAAFGAAAVVGRERRAKALTRRRGGP